MAFIQTIDENEAEGELARLYKRFANPDGSVDDILKLHALNPSSLDAHGALYVQAMHGPSPLSHVEREMIAVAVSRINQCHY